MLKQALIKLLSTKTPVEFTSKGNFQLPNNNKNLWKESNSLDTPYRAYNAWLYYTTVMFCFKKIGRKDRRARDKTKEEVEEIKGKSLWGTVTNKELHA